MAADLSAASIGVESIWSRQQSSWSGRAIDTVLLYFFYILKNNLNDLNSSFFSMELKIAAETEIYKGWSVLHHRNVHSNYSIQRWT